MSIDKIKTGDNLTQSLDIVSDNISKLKELFPEVLTEGKIDFKVLQDILGNEIEEEEEFYRFTWSGKSQSRREAHKPSTGTLRPCKGESVDWDTTQNLYIEGDNLEVLKLLQKSYSNKVKMIYIDPPYNTGKDFVYKDNYKDNIKNYQLVTGQVDEDGNKISTNTEIDGRFHSNWLNLMYPRLRLARNLLKDDGVVFVSIDENEVDNLKKVCNEVFSEQNFVSQLTIIVKTEGRRYGHFAKTHEYILVYSKNIESLNLNELEVEGKEFRFNDSIGGFDLKELRNQNTRAFNSTNRRNLRYPFYVNEKSEDSNGLMSVSVLNKEGWTEVNAIIVDGLESVWRWGKDTAQKNEEESLIARRGSDGIIRVFQKYRSSTQAPKTVWFDKDIISIKGTKEIQSLFNGKTVFDFPKPVELIRRLIEIGTDDGDIILDFFSGSSTTGHSTLLQNSIDGKNRNFILVQLPEKVEKGNDSYDLGFKTICDIARERLRRSGIKIKNETPLISDNLDIGFKSFKLDSSNIKGWDGHPDNLLNNLFESQDNIKSDRTEEDVLFEILLKYGLDLTIPIEEKLVEGKNVFNVGFGALFICLGNDLTSKVAEGIGQWKETLKPETCRVIFKDGGFTDVEKTNSVQTLKRFGIQEIKSI
jgi:adenine-specific DNA-methyltransferase